MKTRDYPLSSNFESVSTMSPPLRISAYTTFKHTYDSGLLLPILNTQNVETENPYFW